MKAYFLITHGSRSPRSVIARQKIEAALKKRCPRIPIGGGCLEGQEHSLREQMCSFAAGLPPQTSIVAIPLFLLKGVHTQVDIPRHIPDDRWQLTPLLGEHPAMANLLDAQFPPGGGRILLCHGSSYPGALTGFEILAQTIGAKPAYWQGEPQWQEHLTARTYAESKSPSSLSPFSRKGEKVVPSPTWEEFQGEGFRKIPLSPVAARNVYLLPYFFAGSYILDKIADQIKEQGQGITLLPTPLTPEVTAQMAEGLAEALK